MFSLSNKPLESLDLKEGLESPKAGAFACFEGRVRNHQDGKEVTALEYEAFPALAQKEAEVILQEARKKFPIIALKCVHRVGKLKIGEMAVWVGVIAAHRDEAFAACRYIIDEVKKRVPIWKKEYFAKGPAEWVNCEHCARSGEVKPAINEAEYYSRQTILPLVGSKGQDKLKKARVLVVGAGGLGTPALEYLAAAGIGTIGICEFDNLEVSNLHRQILYSHKDVGQSKITLAARRLKELNPFTNIQEHPERLTAVNVEKIIRDYDLIVDGSDNFLAKYLLNDAAVLNGIPLVLGSVFQLEGQIRFINPKEKFSCLRCLWPEMPPLSCTGSCVENGIIGVVPGVVGTYEALLAIKYLLGLSVLKSDEMLIFDLNNNAMRSLRIPKDPACPLCGKKPKIKKISPELYEESAQDDIDVDIASIPHPQLVDFKLIDIREPSEYASNAVNTEQCLRVPMSRILQNKFEFDTRQKYLLFCGKGFRSRRLATQLRDRGFHSIFSIRNGISAVKKYLKDE